jgi:hypothetical protein
VSLQAHCEQKSSDPLVSSEVVYKIQNTTVPQVLERLPEFIAWMGILGIKPSEMRFEIVDLKEVEILPDLPAFFNESV